MSKVIKSPWILHYAGAGCGGCSSEVMACFAPVYDVERLGFVNTGNPEHADIFLVTGAVNEKNRSVIKRLYDQMPEPKVVVAVGACACSGGIFAEGEGVLGGAETVIPVDVYVPGCAARPEAVIDGLMKCLEVFKEKNDVIEEETVESITSDSTAECICEKETVSEVYANNRLPLGPQHPLLPESVLFDLSLNDGKVSEVVPVTGFTFKGAEKQAENRGCWQAAVVMERICGNNSFGHSWGISAAIEEAKHIRIPERAIYLRTVIMEMSRVQGHILRLAEIADAIGFEAMAAHYWTVREHVLDLLEAMTGSRLIHSICRPGGLTRDIDDDVLKEAAESLLDVKAEIRKLADIFVEDVSVLDRLQCSGTIERSEAEELCAAGLVARGCGILQDARVNSSLGIYDLLGFEPVTEEDGDCLARCRVRINEIYQSIEMICRAVEIMPAGPVYIDTKGSLGGEAAVRIELTDGEAIYYVKCSGADTLSRVSVVTASAANMDILVELMGGCDVADVPLIIMSAGLNVSGMER